MGLGKHKRAELYEADNEAESGHEAVRRISHIRLVLESWKQTSGGSWTRYIFLFPSFAFGGQQSQETRDQRGVEKS
jgi:hypothetical protein